MLNHWTISNMLNKRTFSGSSDENVVVMNSYFGGSSNIRKLLKQLEGEYVDIME